MQGQKKIMNEKFLQVLKVKNEESAKKDHELTTL